MPSDSGTIWLLGDVIRYEASTELPGWEVPLADVLVIGECTRPGPSVRDFVLCFGTRGGGWHEASCYAAGCDDFLRLVSSRLGSQLTHQLQLTFDFADRILWPPEAVGHPLFKLVPDPDPTMGKRLVSLRWRVRKEVFSDEVMAILNGPTTK